MSILKYFRREKRQQGQFLPSPNAFSSDLSPAIQSANDRVGDLSSELPSKCRKVSERHVYSPRKCASIGHYAALHGPKRATVYYGKQLAHNVPESICRKFRDEYRKELQKRAESVAPGETVQVTELPKKPLRRSLLLSDVDEVVQKYVRQMRLCGGVVNTTVIVAAATSLMLEKNKSALSEYGGHIKINSSCAKSLLHRMRFVKRKGTSSVKITPSEFESVKTVFLTG